MMNITRAIQSGRNSKRRIAMKLFGVTLTTLAILTLIAGCTGNTPVTSQAADIAGFVVKGSFDRLWSGRPPMEIVDGNYVWKDVVENTNFHGDLEGTSVQKVNMVVHAIVTRPNTGGHDYISAQITAGTFTGTVNGKKGNFSYTGLINGGWEWYDSSVNPVNYGGNEEYTIVSGTGELSDLRGTFGGSIGQDQNNSISPGYYIGTLRFEE
jgi:hypothetical protein